MQLFKNVSLPSWQYVVGAGVVLIGVFLVFFGKGADLGATIPIVPSDFTEQVSVSGTVVAAQDVSLGFASNGRIDGTYVTVGQHVERGAVLAEIENGDLVASLAQARANLASLRSGTRSEEVAVAATGVKNAEASLAKAIQSAYTTADTAVHNQTDIFFTNPRTSPSLSFPGTSAELKSTVERERLAVESLLSDWGVIAKGPDAVDIESAANTSKVYLARIGTLLADTNTALNQSVPDQTVSAATLASYKSSLAAARANVDAVSSALTAASSALSSAQKTLVLKQAGPTPEAVAAQEAAIRATEAALAKTRVVAPFAGTITRMDAKTGESVSPAVSSIAMQSDGVFQIETYVPEVSIARIMVGNTATTTLDAYGAMAYFPSTVIAVDPAETVKDGVSTYKTTLSFLTKDVRIRSGMTTSVSIATGILRDAIVIPSGAVGVADGVSYVSVMKAGKVEKRTVTTGASPTLGQTQILSGLAAGDTILLTPVP